MFNLKNNKKIGLLLTTMMAGIAMVGCSEDVSAIDPSNIKDTKTIEKKVDSSKENKSSINKEVKNEDSTLNADDAQNIVRKILGDNDWETKETIISQNRELYVIQRIGTDADYRFLVDKKTGEAFCESSISAGEYHKIQNIEDVENYLSGNSNINYSCPTDEELETDTYKDSAPEESTSYGVDKSDGISSEEAKIIIRDEYYGLDIKEPVKTTYEGKDVWSVEHKTEIAGQSYTHILYVDCNTGEVYSAY